MQNLTNTISEVLSDLLPQHLVRIITPKLVRAIETNSVELKSERNVEYE